jgi:uncharacterized protein YciI/heme-degrading monooxygenase HmoA
MRKAMHYLLFYEVTGDYVARRAQFRDAHLKKAWEASARGELVLGGAFANPIDGAVLLFKGDSPAVAEDFAKADPYVVSGAVKRWRVREWTTVAGEDAAKPVRPHAAAEDDGSSNESSATGSFPASHKPGMILRMWKARSTAEKEGAYVQHATKKVFPSLRAIEGYRGAYLLRRSVDGAVELMVLTLWKSMDAIRRFAGSKPERAVVEPEARAVLTDFDNSVTHFEVIQDPQSTE